MSNELNNFMVNESKSKATIINDKIIEVIAPDGEVFSVLVKTGIYNNEELRHYRLRVIEDFFNKRFSDDKEIMRNNIWRDFSLNGLSFMGMSPGNRQGERTRIGQRIRQIREEKEIEAKDLAKLANIDAANLSRIEQGKYSVGIDILSKLAFVLGCYIDIVPIEIQSV